ncbi:aminofutalosine deaminase family hydrolase [Helicobacter sp. MIT 99-5507]|uniref:aminofutalosine deaminase family hydrolase n=1 Tax=Helicobacter sp. MIT 99-5507 TaxID=152489 RepID=UPI0015F1A803|nr:aminofutalosine deaminase family hydrolase [Helicobacter sp. MIT 99-5507]
MKLIGASIIITCDENFKIIKDGGVLFCDKNIIKVGKFDELKQDDLQEVRFYQSCVIMPALINSHIHFEFSKNYSTLHYGNFGKWLDSIMQNRDMLMQDAEIYIKTAIKETLKSGVGCVGAISSNGLDIDFLSKSTLKVVLFNEIMGTNKDFFNIVKDNFKARLEKSKLLEDSRFRAAIALHSPYSLDIELAKYAIDLAKDYKMLVSTHFLESKEELTWLENNNGYFRDFFKYFFKNQNAKPCYSKESFLELFKECQSLFVHCLHLDNNTWDKISKLNASIVSAPRSNRLLNNKYFDLTKANEYNFPFIIATDGRSSNNSLNMLDEARCALFAYKDYEINNLAKEIILAMTKNPAKVLGFNNGILESNKASDFAVFYIKDIEMTTQIELNVILHANEVQDLYINGKRIDIENN